MLDMCSEPIFCSKVAQKGKICPRLLEPQKVAEKLPSTIGKGLPTTHKGLKHVTLVCLPCSMLVYFHFPKYYIWNKKKR